MRMPSPSAPDTKLNPMNVAIAMIAINVQTHPFNPAAAEAEDAVDAFGSARNGGGSRHTGCQDSSGDGCGDAGSTNSQPHRSDGTNKPGVTPHDATRTTPQPCR
jgi:hypothetical protein